MKILYICNIILSEMKIIILISPSAELPPDSHSMSMVFLFITQK